ncbi:MAG TPA: LysE family transporter [Candidatus Brocadiia bacterium]|nr:LysE family transporter [Candidatus Brocadiia bacterium]
MWNLAYIASVSFVMALSGAMMPGPLMAVTVAESARRGPWAGPALMVGHAALELGLLLALMLGMKPLLEREATFAVIAVVGAGALLWMAAGMLRSLPRLSLLTDASGGGGAKLALRGVALSLVNPYWSLWWATIGLSCVGKFCRDGWVGIGVFYVGHIAGDLAWYAAISAAVAKGRRLLSDRLYRWLVGACAVFLAGFGLYFLGSGVSGLRGLF